MKVEDIGKISYGSVVEIKGKAVLAYSTPKPSYYDRSKYTINLIVENANRNTGLFRTEDPVDLDQMNLITDEAQASAVRLAQRLPLAWGVPTINGSDPEIFVADEKGKVIPSWKFLPTKEDAHKERDLKYQQSSVYWDGFQAEIGTKAGYSCHEVLTVSIWTGLKALYNKAIAFDSKAKLLAEDVVKVSRKDLTEAAEEHVIFGCAPSYNAYGIPAIEVGDPRKLAYRFSGTHYHFSTGSVPEPAWYPNGTAIMIDKIGGLMLTALGRGRENPMRREFYGRPGEFRTPNKGYMEYRTTGSFVMRSPSLFIFGADVCRMGFKMGMIADGASFDLPEVKDIILNCDADAAVKVIEEHKRLFRDILNLVYDKDVAVKTMDLLLSKKEVKLKSIEDEWGVAKKPGSAEPTIIQPNYHWRGFITQQV